MVWPATTGFLVLAAAVLLHSGVALGEGGASPDSNRPVRGGAGIPSPSGAAAPLDQQENPTRPAGYGPDHGRPSANVAAPAGDIADDPSRGLAGGPASGLSGDPAAAPIDHPADDPSDDPADDPSDDPASPARSAVQVLGEGATVLYLAEHAPLWSMHADNVPADALFRLWRGVGGPEVLSKQLLDYPYTMSVHRMSPERIIMRILDGFNYTLQYRNGALASVHVLSAVPSRIYKTPRLVEPRSKWTKVELDLLAGGGDPAANPVVPVVVVPPVGADSPVAPAPPAAPPTTPMATKPATRPPPSMQPAGGMMGAGRSRPQRKPPASEEKPALDKGAARQRLPHRGSPQ